MPKLESNQNQANSENLPVNHQRLTVLQVCAVDFTVKNFLAPLIKALQDQGFAVTTVCSPGPFVAELRKAGLKIQPIKIARSFNIFSHVKSLVKIYRFIKREKFHIVHVHTPVASFIGRAAAWLARTPIIIYTAHGFYFHDNMHPLLRRFHILLERFFALLADFIFTQSEEDRQVAIKAKICPPQKIVTIGNGIDLGKFNPERITAGRLSQLRQEFHIPDNGKVVGIIGRLVREKGFFEYFRAAKLILAQFRGTRFLIIGEALESDYDTSKVELYKLISKLGIGKNIVFAGMRDDIPELLSLIDVYAFPSYREGMPRSILEAMAMKKPVVATNIRGCREEVVNGQTGFLVPVQDSQALASSIIKLLSNPDMARQMGENGRQRVEQYFSEAMVINKQQQVYKDLIAAKGLDSNDTGNRGQ